MTGSVSYQKPAKWGSDSSSDSSGFDDDSDHKFENKAEPSSASSYNIEKISELWDASSSDSSSDESQDSFKNTTNRWTSSSDSSDLDSSKSFLTQDTQDRANPPSSEDAEPFDNWNSPSSTDSSDSDEDQLTVQGTTAYSTDLTNFNQIIQEKMKGVCLIITPSTRGTGVLIGSDLLITNHHVVPNEKVAAKSQAVFFKYRKEKTVQFELTPEIDLNPYERSNGFFVTSPRKGTINNPQSVDEDHLDYTIVALKHTEVLAKVYNHALSLFHSVKPSINDRISLIQHPDVLTTDRLVKGKLCFDVGSVTKVFDCEVRHNAKAAPGSSGGALINAQGDFIALHYQGKQVERLGVRTSMISRDLSRKKKLENVKNRTTVPLESILEAKLKECLEKNYKARETLTVLNMQDDGDFEYHLPIEHAYTRLAMIKEEERDEQNQKLKNEKLSGVQDLRPITHEAIFKPKAPILPKEIWNAKKLEEKGEKRVIIFGSAGSGKSTFCHHVSFDWANGRLWNKEFKFLFWTPLRNLELKKYENKSIYQILAEECGMKEMALLDLFNKEDIRKKSLLILDGYDELSASKQGLFDQLKKAFPNILLTSRPQRVSRFNQVSELEVLGFDDEGIFEYVKTYFEQRKQNLNSAEKAKRKENLETELKKEPILKSLASIPINLTLLCTLFLDREETFKLERPITITSIYIEITEWLCKRFLMKHESGKYSHDDVVDLSNPFDLDEANPIALALETLAWKATCEKDGSLYLSSRDIGRCLKKVAETELKKMGIFRIQKREGRFIHLTFQEFFAARHLARWYLEGNQQKVKEFIQKNKFDPRYRLMLSMTSGYLSYKNEDILQAFFDDLFSKPRDLAKGYELSLFARCFEECNAHEKVKQYKELVKCAAEYIKQAPIQEMNFQLLNRSPRLLDNQVIVNALLEPKEKRKLREANKLIRQLHQTALVLDSVVEKIIFLVNKNHKIYCIESLVDIMNTIYEIGGMEKVTKLINNESYNQSAISKKKRKSRETIDARKERMIKCFFQTEIWVALCYVKIEKKLDAANDIKAIKSFFLKELSEFSSKSFSFNSFRYILMAQDKAFLKLELLLKESESLKNKKEAKFFFGLLKKLIKSSSYDDSFRVKIIKTLEQAILSNTLLGQEKCLKVILDFSSTASSPFIQQSRINALWNISLDGTESIQKNAFEGLKKASKSESYDLQEKLFNFIKKRKERVGDSFNKNPVGSGTIPQQFGQHDCHEEKFVLILSELQKSKFFGIRSRVIPFCKKHYPSISSVQELCKLPKVVNLCKAIDSSSDLNLALEEFFKGGVFSLFPHVRSKVISLIKKESKVSEECLDICLENINTIPLRGGLDILNEIIKEKKIAAEETAVDLILNLKDKAQKICFLGCALQPDFLEVILEITKVYPKLSEKALDSLIKLAKEASLTSYQEKIIRFLKKNSTHLLSKKNIIDKNLLIEACWLLQWPCYKLSSDKITLHDNNSKIIHKLIKSKKDALVSHILVDNNQQASNSSFSSSNSSIGQTLEDQLKEIQKCPRACDIDAFKKRVNSSELPQSQKDSYCERVERMRQSSSSSSSSNK
ncbi:NACHT domain-containing protein [Candidatus Neptunochlamydia vexilliferae]|uniref:Serine protease n=1 Tax=Candidatus Neptunichlamydia vexilliferae TaxID=1651774 RepID=A0ABS0AY30_9BACT|nr:NACHT domain-containing protein [Candidatus Neptunochlamydia vexilliferae]MBF5059043.1 hypothetical protein [Candidatus Neptunochlamydia vexilliferae]